jgi:hypothetical protein
LRGLSTKADVRLLFGRPEIQSRVRGMRFGTTKSASTTRLKNFLAMSVEGEGREVTPGCGHRKASATRRPFQRANPGGGALAN